MGERKVEIPVDFDVKELLKSGKGNLTWDQYLLRLKQQADAMERNAKKFGGKK